MSCNSSDSVSIVYQGRLMSSFMLAVCYLASHFTKLQQVFTVQARQVQRLESRITAAQKDAQAAVRMAAACQEKTAQVLNQQFERHALHPAVLAVVELVDQIDRLCTCTQPDSADQKAISRELELAKVLAHETLAGLDITVSYPDRGLLLDPGAHQVCGIEATEELSLDNGVSEVLTAGVVYRGVVLKKARVKVFKCNKKDERTLL